MARASYSRLIFEHVGLDGLGFADDWTEEHDDYDCYSGLDGMCA